MHGVFFGYLWKGYTQCVKCVWWANLRLGQHPNFRAKCRISWAKRQLVKAVWWHLHQIEKKVRSFRAWIVLLISSTMITEEVIFLNQVSKPKYENQIQQLVPSAKLFLGLYTKISYKTQQSSRSSSMRHAVNPSSQVISHAVFKAIWKKVVELVLNSREYITKYCAYECILYASVYTKNGVGIVKRRIKMTRWSGTRGPGIEWTIVA